jgi:hypothetical protein
MPGALDCDYTLRMPVISVFDFRHLSITYYHYHHYHRHHHHLVFSKLCTHTLKVVPVGVNKNVFLVTMKLLGHGGCYVVPLLLTF